MPHELIGLGPAPSEEDCVPVGHADYQRLARLECRLDRRGIRHSFSESGAFAAIHGEIRTVNGKRVATPEYRSWQMMKNRCNNPKSQDWPLYGGRGIGYDPDWNDFGRFLVDLSRRPTPSHTLERIDVNADYNRENCIWATPAIQARNKRNSKLSDDKVAQIFQMREDRGMTHKAIAAVLGVCTASVSHVLNGRTWKPE